MLGFSPLGTEPLGTIPDAEDATVETTVSWIESPDLLDIAGTAGAVVSAVAAWGEAPDVVSVTGGVGVVVLGGIGWTEPADVASISITASVQPYARAPAGAGYSPRHMPQSRPRQIQGFPQ